VNTRQLLTARPDAGTAVDLRIFPPGAHGAAYNGPSVRVMYRASFDVLERNLKLAGKPTMVP
jgi:dipeptidyl-peptidase-4